MYNDQANDGLVPLLSILLAVSFIYNIGELYLERQKYFLDIWNIIDAISNCLTLIYLLIWNDD